MRTLLLSALLCTLPPVQAQDADDPRFERIDKQAPTQEEIDSILLVPTVVDGISYIGGGIGVAERAALEQWAKGYTLRIEMARKSGEYLGDMRLRILDGQGRVVLEAPSDGPLFYVQLPEGRYTVEVAPPAQPGPAPQRREVKITSGKQARLFFVWP